ncbi:MAG: response regulator [Hyphomicrobiaceae bacterium]|nr:response regulator [Hyphomicrobiaceae bacterium]
MSTAGWSSSSEKRLDAVAGGLPVEPPQDALAARAVSLEGVSVLLVEDSWHIAVALKSLLENAGLVVDGPAGSLARANALLDQRAPDLAIVDINIKGRMSFDLIDRLAERCVPVIVVSGYDETARLEGKVAASLQKPIRAGELLAALRRVVMTRTAS